MFRVRELPLKVKKDSINLKFVEMLNTKLYDPIFLHETDQVKFMNRTDRKYWFNLNDLSAVLNSLHHYYYLLQIEGECKMPYFTTYFDTPDNEMFTTHHNGKLNRFKIRKRFYEVSGIGFLEVKFKSNKGRTFKKRIQTNTSANIFSDEEKDFINLNTPYSASDLNFALENRFTRITLVNKNFNERCTIDSNLKYFYKGKFTDLKNLVIVEIKSDRNSEDSPLKIALRDNRIKYSGFSKYCIGRSVTNDQLKRNAFKPKLRRLEKILENKYNLYTIN